jgi:hypothetical protein
MSLKWHRSCCCFEKISGLFSRVFRESFYHKIIKFLKSALDVYDTAGLSSPACLLLSFFFRVLRELVRIVCKKKKCFLLRCLTFAAVFLTETCIRFTAGFKGEKIVDTPTQLSELSSATV